MESRRHKGVIEPGTCYGNIWDLCVNKNAMDSVELSEKLLFA